MGTAYLAVALTVSASIAPLALPILTPRTLIAYEQALHLQQQAQEHSDDGSALPPLFSDELGWHDFVRQVAAAYDAVPPALRSHTGILVDNYGEASALDVYGFAYGLPPALSGHNQYYLWGERGQHVETLVRVQRHVEKLRPYCTRMRVVGTTESPFARRLENGKAIAICEGLHPALTAIWPQLKEII